jgi:hypothetical protein
VYLRIIYNDLTHHGTNLDAPNKNTKIPDKELKNPPILDIIEPTKKVINIFINI